MQFAPPEWVDRVTSTNTALMERLAAGTRLAPGHVLATAEQTAGRGRGRHRWISQPGRDLSCSFVLHTDKDPNRLCSLSMAVALGVVTCLDQLGLAARTKWPNDVVVDGRKIAGILPELAAGATGGEGQTVVVGLGLNIGMSAAEAEAIDQPATSLFIETGQTPSPQDLLPPLLSAVAPRLDDWHARGFAGLRPAWEECCVGLGRLVSIVDGRRCRRGILSGFGDDGQLRLDEGAGVREVWSGTLRLEPE